MLKKIVITLALVALASTAFAGSTPIANAIGVPAGITFVPSKSVILGYGSGNGGATGTNSVYSIASKNTAGDKIYAATSASSAIVVKVGAAGAALQATDMTHVPTNISDSSVDTGFSIL